ncbi:MAG: LysR family transcriptional regulator [Eggerthellales bacterium]|nr:LysR family transcriptional regulator [Eggerthellales bacterium]
MTLQQLKYLIEVARYGSFNSAAQKLYVSQSTLSMAIKDLENELGIQVFIRSNRGLTLTNDGTELLGYARQMIEQADLLKNRYASRKTSHHNRLSISTQHYAFTVQAFLELVNEFQGDQYDFTLRETRTGEIIEDVREFRSELGLIYLDDFNERVLVRALEEANLSFTLLFEAAAHVFVGDHHPLAGRSIIHPEDLKDYPRYSFEQGTANSFHFAEEPLASVPHSKNITYSDRGTLTNLLTHGPGYTLSTGVLSAEMHSGIVAIPLDVDVVMRVGYIMHNERKPSPLVLEYISKLEKIITESGLVTAAY